MYTKLSSFFITQTTCGILYIGRPKCFVAHLPYWAKPFVHLCILGTLPLMHSVVWIQHPWCNVQTYKKERHKELVEVTPQLCLEDVTNAVRPSRLYNNYTCYIPNLCWHLVLEKVYTSARIHNYISFNWVIYLHGFCLVQWNDCLIKLHAK